MFMDQIIRRILVNIQSIPHKVELALCGILLYVVYALAQ